MNININIYGATFIKSVNSLLQGDLSKAKQPLSRGQPIKKEMRNLYFFLMKESLSLICFYLNEFLTDLIYF